MEGLPSLPTSGPLRALAISGSVSLLLFVLAVATALFHRPRRQAVWPLSVIVVALGTTLAGRVSSSLHILGALLTVGTTIAAALRVQGVTRLLLALGAVAWLFALFAARALFH